MEKGGVSSMDGSIVQDVWDWEVLPDEHRSFYAETRPAASHVAHGGGGEAPPGDQETEEPILHPSEDADRHASKLDDECKDIGVVVAPAPETRSTQEESMAPPAVTELQASDVDGEEEEETFQSSDAKEVDDDKPVAPEETAQRFAGEEEEMKKVGRARRPACVVFSVGKLRVNGVGALCSFGVAAATVCVFLVGGRLQHQQKQHQQQQEKLQLQFLGDDKRMQQVVQQTSRLNQAMSSVMGAAGGSTRAKISFGGFYDGF